MKINIIANQMRTDRGEPLTVEMLKAELIEVKSLKAVTINQKLAKMRHIDSLEAAINYKLNRIK